MDRRVPCPPCVLSAHFLCEKVVARKNLSFHDLSKAKPEHVYMRLERQDESLLCKIGPDGKSWLVIGGSNLLGLPSKLKVALAAYSTSTDSSKVVFDQLQITKGKKARKEVQK